MSFESVNAGGVREYPFAPDAAPWLAPGCLDTPPARGSPAVGRGSSRSARGFDADAGIVIAPRGHRIDGQCIVIRDGG
jgi:hypothetical protein